MYVYDKCFQVPVHEQDRLLFVLFIIMAQLSDYFRSSNSKINK